MHTRQGWIILVILAGCASVSAPLRQDQRSAGSTTSPGGPASNGGSPPAGSLGPARGAVFSPPATVGDCGESRLEVVEEELDLGAPYRNSQYRPLQMSVSHHSHRVGGQIVLVVLVAAASDQLIGLEARRFDPAAGRWLASVADPHPPQSGLGPPFVEVQSGVSGESVLVKWVDITRRTTVHRFDVTTGTWSDADPAAALPPFNGLASAATYPPNPEPTTGVSVEVSGEQRTVTLTGADGRRLGTIAFASRPGAYVGAFPNRRTALLWSNQADTAQRDLPVAERFDSFLVGLETGAACRIPRELVFDATAVFRVQDAIVMLNVLRTEEERSSCPPGAPCAAPKQAHFRGVSITTLRDRGE